MTDGNDGRWCQYKPEVYCQEYHCSNCTMNPYEAITWMSVDEYVKLRNAGAFPVNLENSMRIN